MAYEWDDSPNVGGGIGRLLSNYADRRQKQQLLEMEQRKIANSDPRVAIEALSKILGGGGQQSQLSGGMPMMTPFPGSGQLSPQQLMQQNQANGISQPITSASQLPIGINSINVAGFNIGPDPIAMEQAKNQMSNQAFLERKKAEMGMEGVGNEAAGKMTLAKESLKNIEEIKKILFPDGTPNSFDKNIAGLSNIPGSKIPVLGSIIPNKLPDPLIVGGSPLYPPEASKKAQDVYRKMGSSLAARQLIQTGVAARPEETEKLIAQFAPSFFSNPESSFNALNELQQFYESWIKETDPQMLKSTGRSSESNNDPLGLR